MEINLPIKMSDIASTKSSVSIIGAKDTDKAEIETSLVPAVPLFNFPTKPRKANHSRAV